MRNWAGNITYGAKRIHRPESTEEVRRIVAEAPGRVRAAGTGHSFNRIADTDGDLVLLDRLPGKPVVDERRRTVTVPAGLRYAELAGTLHARGWALANLASLPHISVAGSVATGTHGSGSRNRSLAADVTRLELVTAGGGLLTLSRETDPERFPGAVTALGALGIVTALTLRIEPAYQVAQLVHEGVRLDALAEDFDRAFAAGYSVSAFTRWRDDAALLTKKRVLPDTHTRPMFRRYGGRLAKETRHPIAGRPTEAVTEQRGVPGPWHERLPHFRPEFTPSSGAELQSEWFLPRSAAPEAFTVLRGLADTLDPVLQTAEVRTVAADDLWMSGAYGRDTAAFHFTWTPDEDGAARAVAAVDAGLAGLGARPHWGKLAAGDPASWAERFPKSGDFAALVRGVDAAGVFRNALTEWVDAR